MALPLENEPEIASLKALRAAEAACVGRPVTISKMRGEIFELADHTRGLVTIHPSYLLRIEDETDKQAQYRQFVGDLRLGAKALLRAH